MKRKLSLVLTLFMLISLCACGSKTSTAPSGTLEEIMNSLYATASESMTEDEQILFTRSVTNTVSPEENAALFGTEQVSYTEALCSSPQITAIAYQCILLRAESAEAAETAASTIRESADLNRWVCVSADKLVVETRGEIVLFVMGPENTANALSEAFAKAE